MTTKTPRQLRLEKRAALKNEAAATSTAICCIGSDDDDVQAISVSSVKTERKIKGEKIKAEKIKSEKIKTEIKAEPEGKKKKKNKGIKKEKPAEMADSRSKQHDEKQGRERKRSRSRRRAPSTSSSSASSSSLSEEEMYRRLKPYTKVQLANLIRKAELNGMAGMVLHPSVAVSPCPPGCILVRLETGREIACKPKNVVPMQAFHVGPHQAPNSQEARLHQVLKTIKVNVDGTTEKTTTTTENISILESSTGPRGGVGYVL